LENWAEPCQHAGVGTPEDMFGPDLALVHHRGFGFHAAACALRPGGLLAFDICDLEWARARRDVPNFAEAREDWAIITRFSIPSPDRFVRDITTFLPNGDGSWRRDREHHENALVQVARIPWLLRQHGVEAKVGSSFGAERNPPGLLAVTGRKVGPA
jgi:hypothetical protein